MANISRDTFKKMKHYVSVRLQQGVPLVDADWNEMEDIRRFELQAFLKWFVGDGVPAGNDGFRIVDVDVGVSGANDFRIQGGDGTPEGAGRCLIEGWDVINESDLSYTGQRLYGNATLADVWKVDPLPELTVPDQNRTDLVYLDVWEREVNDQEDAELTNPAIGVPTCVRIKREWVVRVLENCDLSEVPKKWEVGGNEQEIRKAGHAYYPLARKVGQRIDDLRRTGLTLANLLMASGKFDTLTVIGVSDLGGNTRVGGNLTVGDSAAGLVRTLSVTGNVGIGTPVTQARLEAVHYTHL